MKLTPKQKLLAFMLIVFGILFNCNLLYWMARFALWVESVLN